MCVHNLEIFVRIITSKSIISTDELEAVNFEDKDRACKNVIGLRYLGEKSKGTLIFRILEHFLHLKIS